MTPKEFLWGIGRRMERSGQRIQGKGYNGPMSWEVGLAVHGRILALAIDIGGNVGNYSAELRSRNPDLELHIFEPSSVNCKKLIERFAGNKNITIVPFAIAPERAEKNLYADEAGSGMGSLTKRNLDHFNIKFDNVEVIRTMPFLEYWQNTLNKRKIDLVKMDVEGHEMDVLRSFGEALDHVDAIQFEFGGACIDTRVYFQDMWYFLHERGFIIYRMSPLGLYPIKQYEEGCEYFSTTNYMAVRR